MIPAEAVEAAAKAMLAAGNHVGGWDNLPTFMRDQLTRDARAAIEAAAPYMLAEAWEKGRRSYRDDLSGTPSYGTPGYKESPNPYMPNTEGEK